MVVNLVNMMMKTYKERILFVSIPNEEVEDELLPVEKVVLVILKKLTTPLTTTTTITTTTIIENHQHTKSMIMK